MAKNISILEGRKSRNFSQTRKLRTNLVGGGTQDWVPEDEAGDYCNFESIEITENGTYIPQGHGYKEAVVNVKNGADDFIAKTIVKNGTYKPADDGAAGYSSVDVKVGGIGSEYTFKIVQNGINITGMDILVSGGDVYARDGGSFYKQTRGEGSFKVIKSGMSNTGGALVELNGNIYDISGHPTRYLRLWNGTNFENITPFPNEEHPIRYGDTVAAEVINGTLYVLGDGASGRTYYNVWRFNGTDFDDLGELLPKNGLYPVSNVVYKNKIHIFYNKATDNHYSFDGSSITKEADVPYGDKMSRAIPAVFNIMGVERIHIITYDYKLHYSFNGQFWRPEEGIDNYGTSVPMSWTINDKFYTSGYELKLVTGGDDNE